MSDNLSELRKRAWDTRRKMYGPNGHSGSYSCGTTQPNDCAFCPARAMIVRLYAAGTLSEGQAAKATGLDSVALRALAQEGNPKPTPDQVDAALDKFAEAREDKI